MISSESRTAVQGLVYLCIAYVNFNAFCYQMTYTWQNIRFKAKHGGSKASAFNSFRKMKEVNNKCVFSTFIECKFPNTDISPKTQDCKTILGLQGRNLNAIQGPLPS